MLPLSHLLLALLVTAIWGFNFVVIKLGVAHVPPLLLTGLRFLFAAVPAVFFVPRPKAPLRNVTAYGVALGIIKFGLLFTAMAAGLAASLSSLVLQLQAFFTIGLAIVVLKDTPKPIQLAGALLAFGGIAIVAVSRWNGPDLVPLLMTVAAAFMWGVANIISKRSGESNMLSYIVWASLVPPLPLFALSWLTEDHGQIIAAVSRPETIAMGAVAYLAWPTTVFGFGVWNFLIQRHSASAIAPFSLLVPIFGILSGALVLNEPFGGANLVGAILVFSGLGLNVFGPRLVTASKARATSR